LQGGLKQARLSSIGRNGAMAVTRPETPAVGFAQRYSFSLNCVVKYDNMPLMARNTRPISWIKAARKDFEAFPLAAQVEMARALTVLAEGQMPEIAKPLTGFESGVMELALRHRGNVPGGLCLADR
jgi:hypothetical protein